MTDVRLTEVVTVIVESTLRKRSGGATGELTNRGAQRVGTPKGSGARRTGVPDGTEQWSSKSSKTSAENAAVHAAEHGPVFGMAERQYVEAAQDFVKKPPPTAEVFVRPNGEVMIYDPATNTFAVRTPEGPPATMFKPTDGVQYWMDELAKWGGVRAPGTR